MKKLFLGAVVLLPLTLLYSCSNNEVGEGSIDHTAHHHQVEEEYEGSIDPICKMAVEDHWELYSLYQEDTVWFCAEHCKEIFDTNPEKYSVLLK